MSFASENEKYIGAKLYCGLLELVAWREGREATLLEFDVARWSEETGKTAECRKLLQNCSVADVRSTVHAGWRILAEVRGKSVRELVADTSRRVRYGLTRDWQDYSNLEKWLVYLTC